MSRMGWEEWKSLQIKRRAARCYPLAWRNQGNHGVMTTVTASSTCTRLVLLIANKELIKEQPIDPYSFLLKCRPLMDSVGGGQMFTEATDELIEF